MIEGSQSRSSQLGIPEDSLDLHIVHPVGRPGRPWVCTRVALVQIVLYVPAPPDLLLSLGAFGHKPAAFRRVVLDTVRPDRVDHRPADSNRRQRHSPPVSCTLPEDSRTLKANVGNSRQSGRCLIPCAGPARSAGPNGPSLARLTQLTLIDEYTFMTNFVKNLCAQLRQARSRASGSQRSGDPYGEQS